MGIWWCVCAFLLFVPAIAEPRTAAGNGSYSFLPSSLLETPALHPSDFNFYRCGDKAHLEKHVVVFHHVYKTAGSTVRSLFRSIAGSQCNLGYATLVRKKGEHYVKDLTPRSGGKEGMISTPQPLGKYTPRLRNEADMLGGHQKFDLVNSIWPELSQDQIGRVTFVRAPLSRFISALVFGARKGPNKFKSETDVLKKLSELTAEKPNDDDVFCNGYWPYLTNATHLKSLPACSNAQENIDLMKANLDMCHVVGVTERWSDSLHLISALVDPSVAMKAQFQMSSVVTKNSSAKISTSKVVAMLEDQPELLGKLKLLLRGEEEVFQHGLSLHLQQVNALNMSMTGGE